jgi:hypothetical protein
MRKWTNNRWLSVTLAAGYVLAVTAASLFHNHAVEDNSGCGHGRSLAHASSADCHHSQSDRDFPRPNAPKTPGQCPSDRGHCSVCHFLGHKPAPSAEVAAVISGALVQEVAAPLSARSTAGVFSAWHSRGPPALA